MEPCEGNRAAVLSLIVRMPTGGKPYTPNGYTGIAIASSLVTLGKNRIQSLKNLLLSISIFVIGNPRKASSDAHSKPAIDDPKGRKGRKCQTTQSTDI